MCFNEFCDDDRVCVCIDRCRYVTAGPGSDGEYAQDDYVSFKLLSQLMLTFARPSLLALCHKLETGFRLPCSFLFRYQRTNSSWLFSVAF